MPYTKLMDWPFRIINLVNNKTLFIDKGSNMARFGGMRDKSKNRGEIRDKEKFKSGMRDSSSLC